MLPLILVALIVAGPCEPSALFDCFAARGIGGLFDCGRYVSERCGR